MGLETGTWIDDLIVTNPPGGDDKRQGDDHLRLIKTVLRNTIKRASKAFFLPGSVSKSANYTILEGDENLTIQCDTTTSFTLTLPVLDSTRAGWMVNVVKATTDMNPVFLVPSSGTINGYAKIRRSIGASITQVMWTGSLWVASRPTGAPVGTVLDYYGSSLPQGCLWADGAAINATNYVEAAAILGATTPDLRGRVGVGRDDMGGSAALRVTNTGSGNSGILGSTLRTAGGTQTHKLVTAELASHSHSLTSGGTANESSHSHTWGGSFQTLASSQAGYTLDHAHSYTDRYFAGSNSTAPGGNPPGGSVTSTTDTTSSSAASGYSLDHVHNFSVSGATSAGSAHNHSLIGSSQAAGSDGFHQNMPPCIICNAIVVAE